MKEPEVLSPNEVHLLSKRIRLISDYTVIQQHHRIIHNYDLKETTNFPLNLSFSSGRYGPVFRPTLEGTFLFVPGLTGANMAAEGDVDLDLEAEENCTGKPAEKPRKHDSGAADLERVTDYAEEKEISSSDLETVRAANVSPETCGHCRLHR